MSDPREPGLEALSPELQWAEAEEALRDCLEQVCPEEVRQDGPSLRAGAVTERPPQAGRATLLNRVHFPRRAAALHKNPVDMLLGLLLRAMQAKFALDADYRRNIRDFTAAYVFTDKAAKICQVARFANGKMHVDATVPENPTFALTFSDGKALLALLFSPAPDVLDALLNQKVSFVGNINYLNKFAYMALRAKPHF